jgi:hypothetical protein
VATLVASACGGGPSVEEIFADPATDPVAATNCATAADVVTALNQAILDVLGDRSIDEYWGLQPGDDTEEIEAAFGLYGERLIELTPTLEEHGCEHEWDDLLCERQPQLEPLGPAGEAYIYENTPCGLEGTLGEVAGAEAEARIEEWYNNQSG